MIEIIKVTGNLVYTGDQRPQVIVNNKETNLQIAQDPGEILAAATATGHKSYLLQIISPMHPVGVWDTLILGGYSHLHYMPSQEILSKTLGTPQKTTLPFIIQS